jgi:aspartate kinase
MIVMKFGGVSMESAKTIERVISIVESHVAQQPFVVVSAMGKTTNRLLEIASNAADGNERSALKTLDELEGYHRSVAEQLFSGRPLETFAGLLSQQCEKLRYTLRKFASRDFLLASAFTDEIASYGEQWSSKIISLALNATGVPVKHFDARQLIVTDDQHTHAVPLYPECYARIRSAVSQANCIGVIGGFIGSTEFGVTTTLGRGGSDLTAAIVGAAVQAGEVQFWKDVDGILSCDPKVFSDACPIASISYAEAAEMARCGANVLHPATVTPAFDRAIPLVVRNFTSPQAKGTRIVPQAEPSSNPVKSIVCRTGVALLQVRVKDPEVGAELVKSLPSLYRRYNVHEELTVLAEGTLSCVVTPNGVHRSLHKIESATAASFREGLAVISLIGEKVTLTPEINKRIAALLQGIPVLTLSNNGTLRLIVDQNDVTVSVKLIHQEFFKNAGAQTFVKSPSPACAREAIGAS